MELSCLQHQDVISYNVIGEIKGIEFPEEIILVGGHLDSWDIGEGAHDDGAGVVQSLQVLETFKKLELDIEDNEAEEPVEEISSEEQLED